MLSESEKQSRLLTENKNTFAYFPLVIETKLPNLKVILTSGYAGKVKGAANAEPSGFKGDVLNKPYTQNELAIRVRATLDEG